MYDSRSKTIEQRITNISDELIDKDQRIKDAFIDIKKLFNKEFRERNLEEERNVKRINKGSGSVSQKRFRQLEALLCGTYVESVFWGYRKMIFIDDYVRKHRAAVKQYKV